MTQKKSVLQKKIEILKAFNEKLKEKMRGNKNKK